jgi:hypothetical protein
VEVLYYTSRSAILEAFVDCGQYAPVEPLNCSISTQDGVEEDATDMELEAH